MIIHLLDFEKCCYFVKVFERERGREGVGVSGGLTKVKETVKEEHREGVINAREREKIRPEGND